jgi:DNA-binding transcriptional LysR family regulator
VNLEQLEAVNAVVEFGSFRAAAEHLNRSQPAVSATIKQLEDEFEILIFDRSNYRPILTEAGVAFLGAANLTLQSAKYTARIARELGRNKVETKLCISVDPLISVDVIEIIAHECSRPFLPVNLIIDKSILNGSHKALLKGDVDLALATLPTDCEDIEYIYLEKVLLVGAVSRKLLQEKKAPDEEFLDKNAQILVYDRRFDETPDEVLLGLNQQKPGHKIFVPDHFTKFNLIEGGIGWGRISKKELDSNKELVLIKEHICKPLELDLCLLRPKNRSIGSTARAIWKIFENRSKVDIHKK